jgi:hypothetical protein
MVMEVAREAVARGPDDIFAAINMLPDMIFLYIKNHNQDRLRGV